MTTVNASSEAYREILKRKQEMEQTRQGLISIARALDSLLGLGSLLGVDEAEVKEQKWK